MRKPLALVTVSMLLIAGGCTPSWYRADADRAVQNLIRDRQATTLGYEPAVELDEVEEAAPPKRSYERVPLTEVAPEQPSALFIPQIQRRAEPIGPRADEPPAPTSNLNLQRVRQYVRDISRLGPQPDVAERALRFGLFDSISYGVQHSRDYRDQLDTLYLAALDVTLQRHLFSPRPFARSRLRYNGGQEDVNFRSALAASAEAGVRQRLPLGGEIVAQGLVEFVNALNDTTQDGESAELSLRASIPLLRGAGLVNLDALISSERELIYSVRAFETFRRDFAIRVASAYFRLLSRQVAIRNRYVRYVSLLDLTARTEAVFKSGRITAIEVQRAQQELLTAEDDVNRAVESYETDLDSFKLLLGMPVEQELIIVPQRVSVPNPDPDVERATQVALQYRLDLQTARDRVDDSVRRTEIARNRLLPSLDFTAGAAVGNRTDDPASQINSDTLTYDAGLVLDLPVDRVEERNAYRSALIRQAQASRRVEQVEDQVQSDARRALRGIRAAQTSIEIQKRGIDIALSRLESANMFLDAGRTSETRNVTESQNALLQAQDRYEQAVVDAQIAILQFLRDTGLLRVDPESGELGLAMERRPIASEMSPSNVEVDRREEVPESPDRGG